MIDCRAVNEYLTLIGEKELPLNLFEMQVKKSNMGQVGREVIWAYESFGLEPKEGTYMRKILDDYRSM